MSDSPSLPLGVCSWSLKVGSIDELVRLAADLGVSHVQIACGDPHHASWAEGDAMPEAARASGLSFTGAMLGFAGEDYTTPATIRASGGFGDPARRAERLDRLRWGLDRTEALGLEDLSLHAGFIPPGGDPARPDFLRTLATAGELAGSRGITLAFETGQETAALLRATLDELGSPRLRVNFDPANMLLYDQGDPIEAVTLLGPRIRSVHLKDALRPASAGAWGTEVPLGTGEVNLPGFLRALLATGYRGPLVVEREAGERAIRIEEIRAGLSRAAAILRELG